MTRTQATESEIRARSHGIWEAEGRPDNQADQHWQQAVLELEQEYADRAAASVDGSDDSGQRALDKGHGTSKWPTARR
jgi:hypothetical protein